MPTRLNLRKVDRARALRTWLTYHEFDDERLSRLLGVPPGDIDKLLSASSMSDRHIAILSGLGVPEGLLPETEEAGPENFS